MSLEKAYDPQKYEDAIYRTWEESGYFNPDNLPGDRKESWSMVLPPPNVTGTLHTGHALTVTIEDVLTRYQRMRGKKTLWLPGTDHAAIATQSKVERELYETEQKTRHDLGRETFLQRVEAFAQESHDTIIAQLKKMGCSLDWSREAYTLDDTRHTAVYTAFTKMYNDGLIYRGSRVINWDPKGQTTVSDDEVIHTETTGTLYTFRYAKDFPIPIATTRPETKLGDTAVAVHPDDTRYKQYVGETFTVSFVGVSLDIVVIADEAIDPEFGTGAVGVTPAHSAIDWEIAQRHNLPLKQVIDEDAHIINTKTALDGKNVADAREAVVDWLKKEALLEKTEEISHNRATAERTGGNIEPLPKLQWFVDVNKEFTLPHSSLKNISSGDTVTLKGLMRAVVESGEIQIVPERFEKIYFHWIDNLRDWCISRQIWFGHQIPVWYREKEVHVGVESPTGEGWEQDPDTLDTWFSSGLWTFSTLGWPEKTDDLSAYHPTDILETGYDILFFWIARMILMSTYLLGEVPFRTTYLHGMVRDEKGQKMSKSLGNALDPLELTEQFGTDALRMAFVVGNPAGSDLNLGEEKIQAYQHFANKVWNASRFVLMNLEGFDPERAVTFSAEDEARRTELHNTAREITEEMERFHLHLAAEKLYHYFWHTFADEIIEETKDRLKGDDEKERATAQALVYEVLTTSLTMLHPFMPFVTETIWQELPHTDTNLLMIAPWPHN